MTVTKPVFGDDTAESLYDDGYERLAEFVDGPVRITDLEPDALLAPLGDGWVLRARNDGEEIQYARGVDDDLIQIRDSGRDGDYGRPFEAWADEVLDYVLSGRYALGYIRPVDSEFEVSDDE